MFYKYYGRDQERIHETSALEIINVVNRHSLLVELLAKAAGKSGGSLKDFNEELRQKGFFDVFTRLIKTKHDEYLTIEESIIRLYEISKLTEKQKYIMSLFSIFTPEKEIFWKVADWADFDMDAIDELIDRAWIERGGIENGFFIHQIIRDSLTKQVGTSLKIEEYGNLLDQVAGTKEYIPQYLDYTMVRERLVLTDDVAKYLEARIAGIIKNKNSLEDNKELIVTAGALFANLSGVYFEQGDYKQAHENLEKALEIHIALFGTEHPITAKTYNNLALLCGEQRNYEQALVNFKRALEILERVLGTEHPDTARVYNAIAGVFHAQGNNEQALLYYTKALKVREKLLGTEHPDTVVTYIGLADVYTDQGNYEQALFYLTKALKIREKLLGAEHPDTAEVYNNLVSVYLAKRDYEQALYYGKKALDICEKCLGTKHFVTAVTCNTLAEIYILQGNSEQALHYCKKAMEICERIRGPKHFDTALIYNNLAAIYQLQGDFEQALYYRKRILEIYERELGPEHPDTVMAYRFLAILYQEQGDFEQAQIYYEKCSENCALHPFISQT